MYHQFNINKVLRSAHTVFLRVLCGSQNKQRLFPYTALTGWFLQPRRRVFTARYGLGLQVQFRLILGLQVSVYERDMIWK